MTPGSFSGQSHSQQCCQKDATKHNALWTINVEAFETNLHTFLIYLQNFVIGELMDLQCFCQQWLLHSLEPLRD